MTKWNTGKIKTFTRTYVTKWFYLWNPNIPHNLLCYCLCDCLIHLYLSHEIIKNEQLNSGSSNQFMIPFLCPFGTHTLFKALLSFHPFHIGFLTTETIFSLPLLSWIRITWILILFVLSFKSFKLSSSFFSFLLLFTPPICSFLEFNNPFYCFI